MPEAVLDPYALRARVYPALLVLLPPAVTIGAIFHDHLTELTALVSLLIAAGSLYALSHLVRRAGRAKEPGLWADWGGKPTTSMLRWRTPESAFTRELIRSRLARIAPDVSLPSPEEEAADPEKADREYEHAVSALREATRDKERFPIVFAENISYGFRRNAWAIRLPGILAAAVSLVAGAYYVTGGANPGALANPAVWAALGVDVLLLVFWVRVVTSGWVKEAAITYAAALFSATSAVGE